VYFLSQFNIQLSRKKDFCALQKRSARMDEQAAQVAHARRNRARTRVLQNGLALEYRFGQM